MKYLEPQTAKQTIHSPISRNYFDHTNKDKIYKSVENYNNIYYNNEDIFNINNN